MKNTIQLAGIFLFSGISFIFAGTSGPLTYSVVGGTQIQITDCDTNTSGVVTIPATLEGKPVTRIGYQAFMDCSGITKIDIPDGLELIDGLAFYNCSGLTYVFIPASVGIINDQVFKNCIHLKRAIFKGNAPSTFGLNVFFNTASGFKIYYGDNATGFSNPWNGYAAAQYDRRFSFEIVSGSSETVSITDYPKSEVGEVDVPSTLAGIAVTKIGNDAFDDCGQLTRITLPNTITSIGDYAFNECAGLTTFTIPKNVTSIGESAFADSGIDSFFFEGDAPLRGAYAFDGYTTILYYLSGAQGFGESPWSHAVEYTGLYDFVVYKETIKITGYPDTETGELTIPETIVGKPVTRIGEDAFYYCDGLTRITLPDSLEYIYPTAFEYCSGLSTITIPTNVIYIGNGAYGGCTLDSVFFEGNAPSTVGVGALAGTTGNTVYYRDGKTGFTTPTWNGYATEAYTNLFEFAVVDETIEITGYPSSETNSVILPAQIVGKPVKTIESYAFFYCKFSSISLPNSLIKIASSAFTGSDLDAIMIPSGVTTIGDNAFYVCSHLESIEVEAGNLNYFSTNGVLFNYNKNKIIRYPQAKRGDYVIPDGIVVIIKPAFQDCEYLYSVIIPETVAVTGNSFTDCSRLQKVVFRGNAPSIYSSTFSNVADGFKIYYPEGKTGYDPTINGHPTESYDGNFSFKIHTLYSWGGMYSTLTQSIELTDYPKTVAGNFVLPNTLINCPVKGIGKSAFQNCPQLTSITFPDQITDIGDFAFENCPLLKTAIFRGDAPALAETAYSGEYGFPYWKTSVFAQADPDFMIYYFSDHTGFSSPTWETYPATEIDRSIYPAAEWLLGYDLPYNTNLTTDVSNDGVDLLMEYALDLVPSDDNSGKMPKLELSGGEMAITFNALRDNVIYIVDQSTDLQTWTTNGIFYTSGTNNIRHAVTLKNDEPKRFLRLRIEAVAP